MDQNLAILYKTEDWLTLWLTRATALVAVGVIIEVAVDVAQHNPTKKWSHYLALIGGVMVAIGVAAEFAIEAQSAQIQTKIRSRHDETEISSINSSEMAKRDAAIAKKDTAKARVMIEVLKHDAVRLKLESELAVAQANARAEQARMEAEKERLERMKLADRVSPRRLTGVQRHAMLQVLKGARSKSKIIIVCNGFDPEAMDLTDDFVVLFSEAGWQARFNKTSLSQDRGIKVGSVLGAPIGPCMLISAALDAGAILHNKVILPADGWEPDVYYLIVDHKNFGSWVRSR